jgi:aspartate kinase
VSQAPVVVKLGGDALARPERIAAQARRLARWAQAGPLVVVASARRGVTDHLLGLVRDVESAVAPADAPASGDLEADRAVASGEVVSAALLALALNRLGCKAVSLDAREAGILAERRGKEGQIRRIRPAPIARLLAEGTVPVVTGFQGVWRGRAVTLGRGGSDTSAVALAVALGAGKVVFVKEAAGIRTADPKLVPDTAPIREAPHHFLTELARAGARVLHPRAAELAESARLPLEFWSLGGDAPETLIHAGAAPPEPLRAAAHHGAEDGAVHVSVLGLATGEHEVHRLALAEDLRALGLTDPVLEERPHGFRVTVPAPLAALAVRAAHQRVISAPHTTQRCSGATCPAG